MRFLLSSLVAVFTFIGLLACNSVDRHLSSAAPESTTTSGQTQQQGDGVRRVTTTELKSMIDTGQAFVVDVRTEASFKAGHIKGAILIPHKDVGARAKELPRDKTIVTYCSWPAEHTSAGAVLDLKKKGIGNAVALLGGFDAWKNAGLPVEKE